MEERKQAVRQAIREYLNTEGATWDGLFDIVMGAISETIDWGDVPEPLRGITLLDPAHLMIDGNDFAWPTRNERETR